MLFLQHTTFLFLSLISFVAAQASAPDYSHQELGKRQVPAQSAPAGPAPVTPPAPPAPPAPPVSNPPVSTVPGPAPAPAPAPVPAGSTPSPAPAGPGGLIQMIVNLFSNIFRSIGSMFNGPIGSSIGRTIRAFVTAPGSFFQKLFAAIQALVSPGAAPATPLASLKAKRRLFQRDTSPDNSGLDELQDLMKRFFIEIEQHL